MIRTYLDTGVLIAAWKDPDPVKRQKARSIVADANREFVSSDYLRLEYMPSVPFQGKDNEVFFANNFFAQVVQVVPVNKQGFEDGYKLACQYGLGGMDALHIHAALEAGVTEFITTEGVTKRMFAVTELTPTFFMSI